MSLITIDETVYDALNGCRQVDVGDIVDSLWGYREFTLSASDIAHLLRGGCLYTEDGEYATVIALERNSKEDKSGDD